MSDYLNYNCHLLLEAGLIYIDVDNQCAYL